MNKGDKLCGFTVTSVRNAADIGAEVTEMIHDKTGARLIWLNNGCENKLFSIGFKTVPEDSTGVFHILEHSVLAGSEKYPVRDPFLELEKSSMNTFLNAMTFPDKTIFPVSSRNPKDFMNLTEVYLDAVFRPSIYKSPNVFYQEGWHIELKDDGSEPLYKGVVFNEMKGALSSVFDLVEEGVMAALFPDTCYRFESGGEPADIPDLTYERFLNDHRRFYHPSNSYIYLDGDMDIVPVLELIESYIGTYDRRTDLPVVEKQKPVSHVVKKREYGINPDEEEKGHTFYALGKILGDNTDREKLYAAKVLVNVLTGSNDSPLKRAILDTGLCGDVSMSVERDLVQPFGELLIHNTDEESCGKIKETIIASAQELVKNGIDKEMLRSAINRVEFTYRDFSEPKSVRRNIFALESWLYGGDPLDYLCLDDVFVSLRNKVDTGYFEEVLKEWLIDEDGMAEVYMLPSKTYNAKLDEDEKRRVTGRVAAMSESERNELIEMNRQLEQWQMSVDTPEQLATLPKLTLEDVSREPLKFPMTVGEYEGIRLLRHTAEKGIAAMTLYFNLSDCTPEEISAISIACELFGELPTAKTSTAELNKRITGLLGGIVFMVDCFSKHDVPEKCQPMLKIKARYLESNAAEALALVGEIAAETDFSRSDLVTEIIQQVDDYLRHDLISSGHIYAMKRANAASSAEASVRELISGHSYVQAVREAAGNEEKLRSIVELAQAALKKVLCRKRLTISLTANAEEEFAPLLDYIPEGEAPAAEEMEYRMETEERQGIVIPSGVGYAAANLPDNHIDRAVTRVAFRLLSLEYLWNEIRVRGGAYGAGALINGSGLQSFYTYRDPSPVRSVGVFREAADFLRVYCTGQPQTEQYIISTIASLEPLRTDADNGMAADDMYFRGVNDEFRKAQRERMLAVTADDLLGCAAAIEKVGNVCIVAPEDKLLKK
ncbi:MAG: insulinase family protein [Ruminococcus sp.]|nr:insulinase family protein [Ruminococcus sp.]